MLLQLDTSAGVTRSDKAEIGKRLPIIAFLLSAGVMIGSLVLVYQWKSLDKNAGWSFLIICSIGLVATLFSFNAMSYYSANLDVNVQTKYVLTIIPVILTFAIVATSRLLENRKLIKLVVLTGMVLLVTQGGGATKQIVNSNEKWYWDDSTIQATGLKVKAILSDLIKE